MGETDRTRPGSAATGAQDPATAMTRTAGLLYLVIILCGVWSEAAVRAALLDPQDAAATARAVAANLPLFRLSILADMVMALADVALAVLLFVLLRPNGPVLALLAAAFRTVQAAMIGASLVLLAGVPRLIETGADTAALNLMLMHGMGYDLGLIFFAANSLVMAVLLRRAAAVPDLLAAAIGASGLVYLAGSGLRLLAPDLQPAFQPAYLVPLLAESAFCLWLLIRARL